MENKFRHLKLQIDSLSIFGALKDDPVISSIRDLLDAIAKSESPDVTVDIYSQIARNLYPVSVDLGEYIRKLVIEDENFYIRDFAAGKRIDDRIEHALNNELGILQSLADLDCKVIKKSIGFDDFLPAWQSHDVDIRYSFKENVKNIMKVGYGIYAKYNFFRVENEKIVPVANPDFQTMDKLYGYERERKLIIKNTEGLINGNGSNMLLYGDAGTGKSTSVKAIAAHYASEGVRIIEMKKTQLYQIPRVMEELSTNPLKFIIFIDDLSFTGNDDNFSALKATLEGSISGTSDNVVIYATSNRRNLVKENFADRDGNEIHINDTLQETMSLAARFGLTITFSKPEKDNYLYIVKKMAIQYGIEMDEDELCKKAEAFAIRKNGRSPRTAKQFIELLKIGI